MRQPTSKTLKGLWSAIPTLGSRAAGFTSACSIATAGDSRKSPAWTAFTRPTATAITFHNKLSEREQTHAKPIRDAGHLHGIIGKARAALTGFLEDSAITRAPYSPVPTEMQRRLKAAFDACGSNELADEHAPR
jgi:hypothetical protein